MRLLLLSLLPLAAVLLTGCKREHLRRTFFRMDTAIEITLATGNGPVVNRTYRRLDSLFTEWEQRFSQTHERSEVRALNGRRDQALRISWQLAEMMRSALRYGDSLDGDFDLTILPIKELWGLGERQENRIVPSADSLRTAVERVDYRRVQLSGDTVRFLRPDVRIDLGGVAKGFTLKEAARILDEEGFQDYLIAAGDVLSRGRRADGRPWRVGIKHPRKGDQLVAVIAMDSGAVFTSGDYERFWEENGKRYHHIFDPRTGRSCTANQALTIWSSDPIAAKFLSTGLFCRPAEEILRYVRSRPGLRCVVVDSSGAIHLAGEWGDALQLQGIEGPSRQGAADPG